MTVVGTDKLTAFGIRYSDAESALSTWQHEVEEARWSSFAQLKLRFPSASFVRKDNVIFNIRGNNYRLHTRINFAAGVVIVVRIGTHKEYNSWTYA